MKPVHEESLLPSQKLSYPQARKVEQTDEYFGVTISDPYRWMEDLDSPELAEWVEQENALTRSVLDAVPERSAMHARLMELINFERYSSPRRRGTRYFYSHNTG
ncbi:MAG TPA: S9 family peptidase, partial [Edaphobacter sp.]